MRGHAVLPEYVVCVTIKRNLGHHRSRPANQQFVCVAVNGKTGAPVMRCHLRCLLVLMLMPSSASAAGSSWSGDMHPSIGLGANPACNFTTLIDCAPSYAQLKAAGKLWSCPRGTATPGACGCDACVESAVGGDNPLCHGQLNASHPCCCPKPGCFTLPQYNTVIGVCKRLRCESPVRRPIS